jgi:hypothetical protein
MKINLARPRKGAFLRVFNSFNPAILAVVLTAGTLLGYRLLSLVPFGEYENPHGLGAATVDQIAGNVIYGPLKALELALLKFTDLDVYLRLASVAFAVVTAIMLYLVIRKWHTRRITVMTMLMFISSSWFLHAGRLADPDILFLFQLPALLLVCLWILSKDSSRTIPLAAVLLAAALYIPGSWIFIGAAVIAFRKFFFRKLKSLSRNNRIFSGTIFLTLVAPLIYSLVRNPGQIVTLLGINKDVSFAPNEIGKRFIEIPHELFWSGPNEPVRWLADTPVLDVFSIAMLLLGVYAYRAGYFPAREKLVFTAGILAILLIGFGGLISLSLLLPVIYVLIANGLSYMLQSWFTVFPRNPLARSFGLIALIIVVTGSCIYGINRYYVAWPRSDATIQSLNSVL